MMPIYGSFLAHYFGNKTASLGAKKACVANMRDYYPLVYSSESELDAILSQAGSVNVSL